MLPYADASCANSVVWSKIDRCKKRFDGTRFFEKRFSKNGSKERYDQGGINKISANDSLSNAQNGGGKSTTITNNASKIYF